MNHKRSIILRKYLFYINKKVPNFTNRYFYFSFYLYYFSLGESKDLLRCYENERECQEARQKDITPILICFIFLTYKQQKFISYGSRGWEIQENKVLIDLVSGGPWLLFHINRNF
jgi:hypothetical protein